MCVWELKKQNIERLMKERKTEVNFRSHAVKSFIYLFIYLFICLFVCLLINYMPLLSR